VSFPDTVWGSPSHPLRRHLVGFSATRPGSWLIRRLVPADRWLYARTGRYTVLGPFGVPIMLLTTTGARSDMPRCTPLLYDRDGDDLVVIGSNFGGTRHPSWTTNLLAHPEATVTLGRRRIPVVAELLTGSAAAAAFRHMADQIPTYDAYRERTDRELRVFRLRARP
jgi:deazaflavin-dependent oxidoreductase (nitroreductase family)